MRLSLLLAPLVIAGCSSGDPSSLNGGGGGSGAGVGASSDELQHCVDVINSYRAKVGATAYARSSSLESFAAVGAQSDSQTSTAHGHFASTSGGDGTAFAENEIPGWPGKQYGGVTGVIDQGLEAMWNEGPGGGHYENMVSTKYSSAGCGTYTTSTGDVWVTIDFK